MSILDNAAPLLPGIIAHGKETEFMSAGWTLYQYGFISDYKKAIEALPTMTPDAQKAVKGALDAFWDILTTLGQDKAYAPKVTAFVAGLFA
jgi:hypothetical protein